MNAIEQLHDAHPNVLPLEIAYVDALLRWAAGGHANETIEQALVEDWGDVEAERQLVIRVAP